ncbi:MAG: serine/threonine-protein kinase, partial [Acidobacteriota bacterium]
MTRPAEARAGGGSDLERIKRLVEEAEAVAADEREAFVRSRTADAPEVGREVLSLLSLDGGDKPWAEGPLIGQYQPLTPGVRIGGYRIERLLGTGGMGVVALAVREDDFTKRVALKVAHHRLSEEWVRRFHAERDILARLEHPHVARILDGGTARDGRPYFVMEWVDGEPIRAYCDDRRLSIRERVELVIDICSALEVAHRNLVVHRDIKPSNILVTEDGRAKLLDFGIAKQLDRDPGDLTQMRGGPMTLRYGSPEQVGGEPITTATDVHGVGVLLYELLSGHHPWPADEQSAYRIADWIRTQDPTRPSAVADNPDVRRSLRGDLDAIILKALRKPPEDRYRSIGALAEDLKRHLDGLPVAARDATWAYVGRRFVRRHRVVLGFASALALTFLVLGSVSTVLWQRAERSQEETTQALLQVDAERQAKDAARAFMQELFMAAGPDTDTEVDGPLMDIVVTAQNDLDQQDPIVQTELLATIGTVYDSWGLLDEAENVYERAADIARHLDPPNLPVLAKAVNNVAVAAFNKGDFETAVEGYSEALAIKKSMSPELQLQHDIGKTISNLANAKTRSGDLEGVEALHLEALSFRERYEPDAYQGVASSLRGLGVLYHEQGRLGEAEDVMTRALEIYRDLGPGFLRRVASTLSGLGRLAHDKGDLETAERFYREAFQIRRRLFKDQPH